MSMLTQDFILNGQGHGPVAETLGSCGFDPGMLRPYYGSDRKPRVTVNSGEMVFNEESGQYEPKRESVLLKDLSDAGIFCPVANATSLRKDEWVRLDNVIIRAARKRLRAWSDLAARSSFGGFNGMATSVLEHETMSDPGEAVVDMDALSEGRHDAPLFQLEGLPLPITHSDFWFSQRRLMTSRNNGTPLDTAMGEAAGRRVAEMVEKVLIGAVTGTTYGDATQYGRAPTVYGYTNFPDRITKTDMNAPTGSNGETVLSDWLALRDLLYDANFFGPFMVYVSNDWDQYLDNLFSTSEPSAGTLRSRLLQIDGIEGIRRLDFLTDTFTVLMVQMDPEVARAVNGMDITTVQWESQGGMRLNFKVMTIMVPQLRADYNGNTGIAHGTTS